MSQVLTDDLMAPEVIADPHQYFGTLRAREPVTWNPEASAWIVTRHADIEWLLRHHELFSSAITAKDTRPPYPPVAETDTEALAKFKAFNDDGFIRHDRPEHLNMRRAVHRWFTPRAVEKWRTEIRETTQALIDRLRPQDGMEARAELAAPLPLMVICRMLNIPFSDGPRLRELTERTTAATGDSPDRLPDAVRAIDELEDYFAPLIAEHEADPTGDDLISMLLASEREGVFTRRQIYANVLLLMTAGHETTINLVCNGILAFVRNPDQWKLLRNAPHDLCRPATEECLRIDPPFKAFWRISNQDLTLGEKSIRAGDRLLWVMAAANRDPEVFTDPDRFDITRTHNRHVAFGGGIHHCLGAALARIEGQEVFSTLATNFSHLELATNRVEYQPDLHLRLLQSLPLRWETS